MGKELTGKELFEESKYGFLISTDKFKLNIASVHDYLSNHSYWAEGISFDIVEKSIDNSVCFGLYENERQISFARIKFHAT